MDESVLAARGRRQINKQDYNIANKLASRFMCQLLEKEGRLMSALYSYLSFLCQIPSLTFFLNSCISFHSSIYLLFFPFFLV